MRSIRLAVAALAGGSLALEIAATRLLSPLFAANLVGAILAAALLGLGLGAALVAAGPRWRSQVALRGAVVAAPLLATIAVVAALAAGRLESPLLALAPLAIAYLAVGVALANLFALHPQRAAPLYRADLLAAGLAAAATPAILAGLGGLAGSAAAAVVLSAAAWALRAHGRQVATALALALLVATTFGGERLQRAALGPSKPIGVQLATGARIEATRWDAFARTDLVRTAAGARYLYLDGGAGSLVPGEDPQRYAQDIGALAFLSGPSERVFLIGSGGGLDVAQARAAGARDITAAEVNRASVALTRALGESAGGVYDGSTQVRIGDGRRELARSTGSFDAITLANVVTGAAELRGAALTENRIYTLEAFELYLSRLTPEGRLALTLYDEATLTRAITTALRALVAGGYAADEAAAVQHLFAAMDPRAQPPIPSLLIRPTPWPSEAAIATARVAEARGWALLMIPELLAPPALAALGRGELSVADLIDGAGSVDLRPTRDAAPYFFALDRGLPTGIANAGRGALAVALALAGAALMLGLRRGAHHGRRFGSAALLGAGSLATQLFALHLLMQTLGHPVGSLALALAALLIGGALGATWRAGEAPRAPSLIAALGVALLALVSPAWMAASAGWAPAMAALPLALALTAVGAPMGMPFPRLLRAWGEVDAAPWGVAAAWAASGVAAVALGAGSLALGQSFGAPALAAVAVLAYLGAALLHPRAWHATSNPSSAP